MPMRRRRQRPPADLDSVPYWQLGRLAERGDITWEQVRDVVADRIRARLGSDPYEHLHPIDDHELHRMRARRALDDR